MSAFSRVKTERPRYSAFNWSNEKVLNMDMGELVPFYCDYLPPGGRLKGDVQSAVRLQPMVAPAYVDISIYYHFFFVPLRLIDENFENWISGGKDGKYDSPPPLWPRQLFGGAGTTADPYKYDNFIPYVGQNHSLFDCMICSKIGTFDGTAYDNDTLPVDWKRRAYNLIWNEWYRNENFQKKIPIFPTDTDTDEFQTIQELSDGVQIYGIPNGHYVQFRNWTKDYFTSSLPFQQRGIAPALPLSGNVPIAVNIIPTNDLGNYKYNLVVSSQDGDGIENGLHQIPNVDSGDVTRFPQLASKSTNDTSRIYGLNDKGIMTEINSEAGDAGLLTVDMSGAATFNVSDLRLAFQIQKFMERNARAGVRYTELLQSHFGVHPLDARLQRPEYLGGTKANVMVSEVLQTSQTSENSPQGTLAGHGISASIDHCFNYRAQEFGLVIGLCSIRPTSMYSQGIPRQDLVRSRYDMLWPEFVNLSEQAVTNGELFFTGHSIDKNIFGFQGRYNEYRTSRSRVMGDLSDKLSYWHLGRMFESTPSLNSDFITCKPSKRIFAVQDEPGFVVDIAMNAKAVLPIPFDAEPGLVDHN